MRRGEHDLEAAVGAHYGRAQHAAVGSHYPHAGAGLAATVEQAAAPGECQVCGGIRCHAIGGSDAHAVGLVAGRIGLAGAELFAVELHAAQGGAEVAIGIDHCRAQVDTAFTDHGNGGAWFAAPGQDQAVAGQHQVAERLWRRSVRRLQGCRQRQAAIAGHCAHMQHFAIGLGTAQVDGEGAVVGDRAAAQHRAVGAVNSDRAARRGGAGDR